MTQWTAARLTPLSLRFLRKEYCSGWPFPLPGDLPDPWGREGVETEAPALAAGFFTMEPPGTLNWQNRYNYPYPTKAKRKLEELE